MGDGLLVTNSIKTLEKMGTNIKGSFDIKDLGNKITRNHKLCTINILTQPLNSLISYYTSHTTADHLYLLID